MGTNYYHRKDDVCPTCGREDEDVHIGKSSGGWTFSFHGTDDIRSWEQWRAALAYGRIEDEYGRALTLPEFEELVAAKLGGLRHYDEMEREYPNSMWGEWLDPEGHSFSGGEFS